MANQIQVAEQPVTIFNNPLAFNWNTKDWRILTLFEPFKHSDLFALKSLEPLHNLGVSFAGGACSASSFLDLHSLEVKPLCMNKFIAIPLDSSSWMDLSYLASCRWAFKSCCTRRKAFWIFGLPKLVDLLRDRRGRFVFFQWEVTLVKMINNARLFRETLKWSWCTLPHSSCQVPLLRSLGRAQLWANTVGVCLKARSRFN